MDATAAPPPLADAISDVLALEGSLACRELLESELARLGEGRTSVVVVGAFKRGKSTLLNALIGREILPTGVVPVTALVTLVESGPRERAVVEAGDGTRREIPLDELVLWVTQRSNPDNVRGVRRIAVELPGLVGGRSVVLADTPGTGSVFRSNTEALRRWLGEIDAALFVVSSDPPIGEEDLALLRDVAGVAGEVLVVLNKVDRLTPEELEESVAYTTAAVERVLGSGARIQPCSARKALEEGPEGTGVDAVAEWVTELGAGRGEAVLLRAVARRAGRGLARELALVELERRAAERSTALIEEAIERLDGLSVELRERLDEVVAAFDEGCLQLMRSHDEAMAGRREAIVGTVSTGLRRAAQELAAAGAGRIRYRRELEAARDRLVREALEPVQADGETRVMEGFARLTARALRRVDELVDEAYDAAASLFDIEIGHFDVTEDFRMESRLEYRVGLPKVNLDYIAEGVLLLLPASLGRNAFLRRHLSRLPEAVDRQLGLIRADLWERLRESGFAFKGELRRRVEEALVRLRGSLERGAAMAEESVGESARRLQRLEEREAVLQRALGTCRTVLPANGRAEP